MTYIEKKGDLHFTIHVFIYLTVYNIHILLFFNFKLIPTETIFIQGESSGEESDYHDITAKVNLCMI